MKNQEYLKKLISLMFTDREEIISGFVIDYTDDWTLMKHNPVDYVIDGYVIIRHKNIDGFKRDSDEKFVEKILKLKGLESIDEEKIPLTNLKTILEYLTDNFGVFQLYTKSEKTCYLGRLVSLTTKKLVIESLDTRGRWDGQMTFKPENIRIIEFDTDYINSLKLVSG